MLRPRLLPLVLTTVVLGGQVALASPSQRSGPAFPSYARILAAKRYARSRAGIVSFTVVDSRGKRYSLDGNRQFVTASVIKAMLMTCFLNMKTVSHESLSSTDRSELHAMITVSDNGAADWVYNQVGDARLYNLAHRLRMRHFSIYGYWANAQLTTNDQSLLMENLSKAIYPRYYPYARSLLSSVVSSESWGIPQVARPLGWRVFFKGGWRGTSRGQLIHQVARLERRGQMIVICVMTDGDPGSGYGQETVAGIAQKLLRKR
jgi:Beta-lactamase enzyme family